MSEMTPQHPAAPETETDANTPRPWPADSWPTPGELADWLSRCTTDERLSYADHSLATAQRAARCVDQQHASLLADLDAARERVRVVEGERDAEAEQSAYWHTMQQKYEARAESAEAAHEAEKAAHERLRAEVEALADRWACRQPDRQMPAAVHRAACFSCSHADALTTLLGGGEAR